MMGHEVEPILVPFHRVLQRLHGVPALVLVAVLYIKPQRHLAPAAGREPVFHQGEITGHQREQIAGLGMRVVPFGEVPPAGQTSLRDRVAVRE